MTPTLFLLNPFCRAGRGGAIWSNISLKLLAYPHKIAVIDSDWKMDLIHALDSDVRVFIAAGGERFLTIGNFHDGSLCDSMRTSVAALNNCCFAYYFIDDVSLVEDSTNGMEEYTQVEVSVFPIPAKSDIQLSSQQIFKEITVMGRISDH